MVKKKFNDETPKEKFERLATKRTQAIIDKIRILGNCSNQYIYEYNEDDIRKIFRAIEEELKTVKAKFLTKNRMEKFSLR